MNTFLTAAKAYVTNNLIKSILLTLLAGLILSSSIFGTVALVTRPSNEREETMSHVMFIKDSQIGAIYFTDYAVGCPEGAWLSVTIDTDSDARAVGCWRLKADNTLLLVDPRGTYNISQRELIKMDTFDRSRFERLTKAERKVSWYPK